MSVGPDPDSALPKVRTRVCRATSTTPFSPSLYKEGYSVGSWWRSPVRAIHVRLDHGAPTVVPEGEARVSRSGAQRSALSGGEQQRVAIAAASGAAVREIVG